MGADTTAFKKDERNPMNTTTTVGYGNTGLEKETGGKMFVGTYGRVVHPMSMITAVGKHLPVLGNGDRL